MKLRSIAIIALTASLALGAFALTGCQKESSSSTSSASSSSASTSSSALNASVDMDNLMSGEHHAVIEVEGYQPIEVTLDADAAPITVTNFADLAENGYYDGKSFYRIVDDFCLQGGTLGNNASGIDPSRGDITGEFSENGVDNPLADNFDRGTIAMARATDPDSASTTFFITLGDASYVGTSLNGKYAAFGTVDPASMLIVDQIVSDYLPYVDDPSMGAISDEGNQPIIKSITITD